MASSLVRKGFCLSLSPHVVFRRSQFLVTLSSSPICSTINSTTSSYHRSLRPLLGGSDTLFLSSISQQHTFRLFSSKVSADENLRKVLDSEIKEARGEAETHDQYPLPNDFPFSIEDNPGDQSISLERDYFGEKIRATVFLNTETDEKDMENEDVSDEGDDNSLQSIISMLVTIDKGGDSFLEISCTINPEEFVIDNIAIKMHDSPDDNEIYEGPPFLDLDEKLQAEFCKYLEERGIKSSLFGFLQDYMIKKEEREYTTWLTSMKEFIEA